MEEAKTPAENIYPELPPEEQKPDVPEKAEEEAEALRAELAKTEEEIATLKQVLHAKEQQATELRKALGITPLSQLKAEINKVQSSQAYKKTSETLKSAGQATASVFNTIGTSVSSKFSEMKNSPTFKSFEEKVEGVSTSIMAKVSGTTKDDSKGDAVYTEEPDDNPITQQPSHVDEVPM